MTQRDNNSPFMQWRPIELAALVIGFIIFWPLGLVVLAWKYWNDRSASPRNLDDVICTGVNNVRDGLASVFGSNRAPNVAADDLAPTGNAEFDAHVRAELERIDAERRKLAEEVRAFHEFLEQERAGGSDVYARFRNQQGGSFSA